MLKYTIIFHRVVNRNFIITLCGVRPMKRRGILPDRHRYLVGKQGAHQGPRFRASLFPLAADLLLVLWLHHPANENLWGYDELLTSGSFIGPRLPLWCLGSPGNQMNGVVNHETDPCYCDAPEIDRPRLRCALPHCQGCGKKWLGCQASWSSGKSSRPEPRVSFSASHLSISVDSGGRAPWGEDGWSL